MSLFKKQNENKMDIKSADQILQNVFEASNKQANSVPFDKLLLRCKYNGFTYDICIILAVLLLATTLIVPVRLLPGFEKSSPRFFVTHHEQYGDELLISLSMSDIDIDNCYFVTPDGDITNAKYFNKLGRTIAFPFPSEEVNIILVSESGKELHLVFTPEE